MRRSTLLAAFVAVLTSPALVVAQAAESVEGLPDRSLPPSLSDFVRAAPRGDASNAQGRDVMRIERLQLTARLADADARSAEARSQQLDLENQRLKLSLQELQLDRAAALLTAPGAKGNVQRSSIWLSRTIEVHWENPGAASDEERGWVRSAIADTWERHSGLRFVGWNAATPSSQGIRIRIEEDGPHCKRLGRHLNGLRDGMVLNFTFRDWCPSCGIERSESIKKIAVHEFGHAIGFAHEQNRLDAPELCRREQQGTNGDWYLTIYDPNSIMNYCNPLWNNDGLLSPLDVRAVQILYGAPDDSDTPPSSSVADPRRIVDTVWLTQCSRQRVANKL